MKNTPLTIVLFLFSFVCLGQQNSLQKFGYKVPAVYSGIMPDKNSDLYFVSVRSGDTAWLKETHTFYTLDNIRVDPEGTEKGLLFDFNNKEFYGTLYYGLYPKNSAKYPQPVYFRKNSKIIGMKCLQG